MMVHQEWKKQFHNGQSNPSMYVAWPTVSVWKAVARGLTMFRGLKAHIPHCVKHNQYASILMLKGLGAYPRKCLKNRCYEI